MRDDKKTVGNFLGEESVGKNFTTRDGKEGQTSDRYSERIGLIEARKWKRQGSDQC